MKCVAITKRGTTCTRDAIGWGLCKLHLGKMKGVKKSKAIKEMLKKVR